MWGHTVINNAYYTKKDGTRVHKKYYVCGAFKNKGKPPAVVMALMHKPQSKKWPNDLRN